MNIDVILTWPKNCDYPLWRQFMRDNRNRFNNVYIMFHQTNALHDFRPFVFNAMAKDNICFRDFQYTASNDWRNAAINQALEYSQSEWVWFTEQDFIIDEPDKFWEEVEKASNNNDFIGVDVSGRWHPCCMFVKRSIVNKTKKNFAVIPEREDHFGRFQKNLEDLSIKKHFINTGWRHLNGLSQNFYLFETGQIPNYNPAIFYGYLKDSLNVNVPIDSIYSELLKNAGIDKNDYSPGVPYRDKT